jgi:hypothetical protein
VGVKPLLLKHDGYVSIWDKDSQGRPLWRSARRVSIGADGKWTASQMTLDEAAEILADVLAAPPGEARVVLTQAEAEVVVDLLDELKVLLPSQPRVGMSPNVRLICQDLSDRISDRLDR